MNNRINNPILAFALLAICFAALTAPVSATAQTATTLSSTPLGVGGNARIVTDVFLGRNTVGPFILSWKGIEADSEVVTRDGVKLSRDADYSINTTVGTITFSLPLRLQQIARVDYICGEGATTNQVPLASAMDFSLFQQGKGAIALNAMYRPDTSLLGSNASSTAPNGLMLLGLVGNAKLNSQSTLTSKFYYDLEGGSVSDRSGMQLSEKSKARYGTFNFSFARAGADFQAADETGITAGMQNISATALLNPIHGIQASASFHQVTDLPASGAGVTVTTLMQKLTGPLTPTTRFTATHTTAFTDTPGSSSDTRDANNLQVVQQIGSNTTATASVDHTALTSDGDTSVTQTSKVTVQNRPTDKITLFGTYQNQLTTSGPIDTASLKVDAETSNRLKLSTLLSDRYNSSGALHDRETTLEYNTSKYLSLSGTMKLLNDTGNESIAGGVGANYKSGKYLELSGNVLMRGAWLSGVPNPDAADTYSMKMAMLVPGTALKVTGGYANNPTDDTGLATNCRTRSLGIQTTIKRLNFKGAYSYEDVYLDPQVNSTVDLQFGYRFSPSTQLSTAYKLSQAYTNYWLATNTYSLSLSHHLGSLLDLILSGQVTNSYRDGLLQNNPEYTANAQLGLRF